MTRQTAAASNLPKLSSRAHLALDVLADGGAFVHRLERNSYTGREQFQHRLQGPRGGVIKGVGHSAFHELMGAGFLAVHAAIGTSVSTYYRLKREG